MQEPEMPLTRKEKLNFLRKGKSFAITEHEREAFNAEVYRSFHKHGKKKFTIRKNKNTGEIRIWRLK